MEQVGNETKTLVLKQEMHKLHQEFEVTDTVATVTYSADLAASDAVDLVVNGTAITQVTYGTSHAATMSAIAAALEAIDTVADATVSSARVITITAVDQTAVPIVSGSITHGGSGTATQTIATDDNIVRKGQPVALESDGRISGLKAATSPVSVIGTSLHDGISGQIVTVCMRAHRIQYCEAGTASLNAGPVKIYGYNTTTNYVEVDDASVTYADQWGWALDAATADGDVIRVAIRD